VDFFLGIIIGVTGYAIYQHIKEQREEAKKPRRGRPPKTQIDVKNEDEK